ncbi:ATP-binding protein [Cupriavidus sp. 2MCAB6]|uniref:ATP-binding protein n=1 Tax=Cupriavidus sp. 2MCAB6 TaxID=3232981 RepID=UPI003F8DDF3B
MAQSRQAAAGTVPRCPSHTSLPSHARKRTTYPHESLKNHIFLQQSAAFLASLYSSPLRSEHESCASQVSRHASPPRRGLRCAPAPVPCADRRRRARSSGALQGDRAKAGADQAAMRWFSAPAMDGYHRSTCDRSGKFVDSGWHASLVLPYELQTDTHGRPPPLEAAATGLPPATARHGKKPPAAAGQEGVGIGLSLVQRLVRLHGGNVHAESAGPGMGCTFVVELPAQRSQNSHRSANSGTRRARRAR